MSVDVRLSSINAGLPTSLKDVFHFSEYDQYLIRPFDVCVGVQSFDKSEADMTVDVTVQPALIGELDSLKLARLLFISRLISATFAGEQKALPATDSSSGKVTRSVDGELERVAMLVRVSVAEVALNLAYEIGSAKESIALSVKMLDVRYFNRPLDANVLVDLTSLSVENSSRSESQRSLARTPDDGKNFFHLSYTSILSTSSPLFKKLASELDIEVANLALNFDADTILNLRPFILSLLGKDSFSKEHADALPVLAAPDASKQSSGGVDMPKNAILIRGTPQGMSASFRLALISLELLRKPVKRGTSTGELETAFSLQLASLAVGIELTDLVKAEVKMRSMDVFDKRPISRDYFYTNLFSMSLPSEAKEEEEQEHKQEDKEEQVFGLSVTYEQQSATIATCLINIPLVASYLSLDSVMNLVDVSMENVNSFLLLTADDGVATNETPKPAEANTRGDEDELVSSLVLTLSNPSSRILFLEDPTLEASKALVCCGALELKFARDVVSQKTQDSLFLAWKDFDFSLLWDLSEWKPQQILAPTNLRFILRRQLECEIVKTCDVGLELSDVDLRVTAQDVLLAQSVITRFTSEGEEEDPEEEVAFKGASTNEQQTLKGEANIPPLIPKDKKGERAVVAEDHKSSGDAEDQV